MQGFVCLIAAAIIFLSFVTYTPFDPSLNTSSGRSPDNWISQFGSYTSDLFLTVLGYPAYLLPIFLIYLAVVYFLGRKPRWSMKRVVGHLLFFVAVCSLVGIARGASAPDQAVIREGGLVGYFVSASLAPIFGKIGGGIILFGTLTLSLMLAIDIRLVDLFAGAWASMKAGVALAHTAIGGAAARVRTALDERRQRKAQAGPMIHTRETPPAAPKPVEAKTIAPVAPAAVGEVAAPPLEVDDEEVPDTVRAAALDAASDAIAPRITEKAKTETVRGQIEFRAFTGTYTPPPADLLAEFRGQNLPVNKEAIMESSGALEAKLAGFGVTGRVSDVHPGPIITMFEFEPTSGIKINKIAQLKTIWRWRFARRRCASSRRFRGRARWASKCRTPCARRFFCAN
ncbi:MAG: DNA translocase FtsK 4TM domain-containing protein [Deltaproteobacteria bacterium]|nr:DNA translocase FtsK 4TM domain-containing protein [Deltaproteobacteria bacterium]